MILTLDIGNSQIHGGIFRDSDLLFQFRKGTKQGNSSDEIGLFLKQVIRENGFDPDEIREISLCSVVPDALHSIRAACIKYFDIHPFILQPGVKTGLKIRYRNPLEVGADRIANAIAATSLYPDQNLIIADYGTATTFCVINSEKEYLGGLITPGFRISMEALELRTAKLPSVEILAPEEMIGRSTVESIQAGLYYSNLWALKGITQEVKTRYFSGKSTRIIGTGGFSRLMESGQIFDVIIPELVLLGLRTALKINDPSAAPSLPSVSSLPSLEGTG